MKARGLLLLLLVLVLAVLALGASVSATAPSEARTPAAKRAARAQFQHKPKAKLDAAEPECAAAKEEASAIKAMRAQRDRLKDQARQDAEAKQQQSLWQWIRRLPLDDVRFVVGFGLAFTVLAFLGNLVVQHDVEEEEDAAKDETANERHMFSFAALHLLSLKPPAWLHPHLREQVEDLLREPLYHAGEGVGPDGSDGSDGSIVVDMGLLLQYAHGGALIPASPASPASEPSAAVLGPSPMDVDPRLRSRALQMQKLLCEGPDSADQVLLSGPAFDVVADFLSESLIVVVKCDFNELSSLVAEMAALAASTADGLRLGAFAGSPSSLRVLPLVAAEVRKLEAAVVSGDIARLLAEHEGFRCFFVGFGLAGSVAAALATAVLQVPEAEVKAEAKSEGKVKAETGAGADGENDTSTSWVRSRDKRRLQAFAFGAVPWRFAEVKDAFYSEEHRRWVFPMLDADGDAAKGMAKGTAAAGSDAAVTDAIFSFVHADDVLPRLTRRNVSAVASYLHGLHEHVEAHVRVEALLQDATPPSVREKLDALVGDLAAGIVTPPSSAAKDAGVGARARGAGTSLGGRVFHVHCQEPSSSSSSSSSTSSSKVTVTASAKAKAKDKDKGKDKGKSKGKDEALEAAAESVWTELSEEEAGQLQLLESWQFLQDHALDSYLFALRQPPCKHASKSSSKQ